MACGKKKRKGKGMRTKFALLTVAFFQYEIADANGMTKICVYDSYKGQAALTIQAWKLCPMTIRVD